MEQVPAQAMIFAADRRWRPTDGGNPDGSVVIQMWPMEIRMWPMEIRMWPDSEDDASGESGPRSDGKSAQKQRVYDEPERIDMTERQ